MIEALKSIFCDVGAPDKLVSDNTSYFVLEEFEDFMMKWAILHITSSPHFPHGNAHAEKAGHVVKQIYLKCDRTCHGTSVEKQKLCWFISLKLTRF